jgi:hypothetical protein
VVPENKYAKQFWMDPIFSTIDRLLLEQVHGGVPAMKQSQDLVVEMELVGSNLEEPHGLDAQIDANDV